jgi:NTE family protein
VILKQGRVVDAVLATIALPGIFPPQEWRGYYLVDGGLMDPVPVAAARALAPGLPVVAVALTSEQPSPVREPEPPAMLQRVPILRQITRLRVAQAFNIFLHAIEIGNISITEMRLHIDKPDVIIRPYLNDIGLLDRVEIAEIVSRGERAASKALPELQRALGWPRRLARRWRTA